MKNEAKKVPYQVQISEMKVIHMNFGKKILRERVLGFQDMWRMKLFSIALVLLVFNWGVFGL